MAETKAPWVVTLNYDQLAGCCLDDFMFAEWKLYSFNRRHLNFRDPEEFDVEGDAELQQAFQQGRAHWLHYYQHGSELWMREGGNIPPGVEFVWDGVRRAGILLYDGELSEDWSYADFCRSADAYLEAYNCVINGEVYEFRVYDAEGNWIDSSGGYVGNLRGMLEEVANVVAGQDFVVEGDLRRCEEALRDLCSARMRKKSND